MTFHEFSKIASVLGCGHMVKFADGSNAEIQELLSRVIANRKNMHIAENTAGNIFKFLREIGPDVTTISRESIPSKILNINSLSPIVSESTLRKFNSNTIDVNRLKGLATLLYQRGGDYQTGIGQDIERINRYGKLNTELHPYMSTKKLRTSVNQLNAGAPAQAPVASNTSSSNVKPTTPTAPAPQSTPSPAAPKTAPVTAAPVSPPTPSPVTTTPKPTPSPAPPVALPRTPMPNVGQASAKAMMRTPGVATLPWFKHPAGKFGLAGLGGGLVALLGQRLYRDR